MPCKNPFFCNIFLFIIFFFGLMCEALPFAFQEVAFQKKQPYVTTKRYHNVNNQANNNSSVKKKGNIKKNLSTEIAGESHSLSPWSNAFNFQKSWGTQVDPRTGTFVAYVKVGSMISNLGHGPNINLQVSYNSNSIADPDELGAGWSWNLTHFNPANNQLSTSQGQSFSLQQMKNGSWWPRYHKLHDIQIDGSKKTHFIITYANGLREVLNHDGFEIRLEQQDGHSVNFYYISGTNLLSAICDNQGHKITLTREEGFLTVTSCDADGKPLNINLNYFEGELRSIILPGEDKQISLNIHMEYQSHLLTRVTYPTGLKKSVTYDCTSAMAMVLPYNNQHHLCVVTRESTDPGASQPEMVVRYSYDQSSTKGHNYLGFNSGLSAVFNLSQDILFEAPVNYTYTTIQDDGLTKQVRTYNKYHLLINVQLISNHTGHLLSEVKNFFCRTNQSNGCSHTSFKDLPVTYSLPLKVVTKNWGENPDYPALETIENNYDTQGRIVSTKDAYGRKKIIRYCPSSGNKFCPAEPVGWSLSTPVQLVIMKPSDQLPASSKAPLTVQNYYRQEANTSGHGYILVLARKVVHSGDQEIITTYQHYDDPGNIFEYGLLKTTTLTGTVSSDRTLTSVTKDYHYFLSADHTTRTVYSTVKVSADQFKRSPIVTTSMFTNQMLEVADAEDKNISRYHYDRWGRVVQIDSGIGTAFAVSKRYQYTVSPQQVQLIITASNGLQQKALFDGIGRQLAIFSEAISASGKGEYGKWDPVKSTTYDNYGRVSAKHVYYTNAQGYIQHLTTTFTYDDLGRMLSMHLPDKENVVKEYDDPDRCIVNFRYDGNKVRSAISITYSNLLDKPIKQVILPANFSNGDPISAKALCKISDTLSVARISSVIYDGFGRVIRSIDPMGRMVTKNYDNLGRVTDITNPLGDRIHNVYNLTGQIVQKWAIPADKSRQYIKRYLLASAQYNAAGELLWKAGEDGKRTWYTYTADEQVKTITTPAGHIISWKYNKVKLPVSETVDGKRRLHFDYNPITTLPVKKIDITGTTTWNYGDDGKVQQLHHTGANNYSDYHFEWKYDNNRRVTSVTGIESNKTSTEYDALSRICSISYQETNGKKGQIFTPVYDGFSRPIAISYGSGMKRTIHYNNYGQTEYVSDNLAGKLLSGWHYSYDKKGNIVSLIHSAGDQQATLRYHYDALDNLTAMTCSGSPDLPLCPRDTSLRGSDLHTPPIITSQNYFFNNLNRMTQLQENLLDAGGKETLSKVVNYGYGDTQVPLRLHKIVTLWNNKTPQTANFTYDTAGNMVIDSTGNHITYNAFNQITSAVNTEGKQAHYFYDGSGRETREEAATGDNRTLFYIGKNLVGEKINNLHQETHTISYLGMAKTIDGVIRDYYEKNYKGDVTGILTKTTKGVYILSQRNIYSPYGMVWHTHTVPSLPWYQKTFVGFDGEQTDPSTGWQFLGAGHRTYNPGQRYFVSEDPVGGGYAFGSNNPVMNTDPGGNMPKWMGSFMHMMSHVGTLGLDVFHKRWASITGVVLSTVLGCTAIGVSACCIGKITPLIATSAIFTATSGIFSIASAAVPANRGLNFASAVVGVLATVADLAAAGVAVFAKVSKFFSGAKAALSDSLSEATSGSDMQERELITVSPESTTQTVLYGSLEYVDAEVVPDFTFDIMRRNLVLFVCESEQQYQPLLSIKSNDEFVEAWKIIVNTGIGVQNNTENLFLLLAKIRLYHCSISLKDFAIYLDLSDTPVPALREWKTTIFESEWIKRIKTINDFEVVDDMYRIGYMMKLPSRGNPYFIYVTMEDNNGFLWSVVRVHGENNMIEMEDVDADIASTLVHEGGVRFY